MYIRIPSNYLDKNGYYFSYQHLFKISQFSSEEIKTEQIYHFIEREANRFFTMIRNIKKCFFNRKNK